MDRLAGLTLLLLAASPAVAAAPADSPGQLRFVEELRFDVQKNGTRVGADLQLVSASRFLKLGMEWERDAKKRLLRPRFKLLDLTTRKAVEVVVPLDSFPAGHRELLGPAPPPELVHHDGETTTMVFKQSQNSRPVAAWLCQYDHRKGRFSELVKVADLGGARFLQLIGFDPPERYFYFAVEIYPPGDAPKTGPVTLELSRVALRGLASDWKMTLELPKRKRPLGLAERHFSPDGSRLALVEHNERSYPAATPPQSVYVIDLAAQTVDTYPAPFTAYGVTFSRDARYLLLGSNDLGELSRIDLVARKIDRRLPGHRLVQRFVLSPSGRSFLLFSNTILASPKVVEVRRVEDLGLQTSVPIRLLFPGLDGTHPSLVSTADGRLLVASICEPSGFPSGTGVRIFEVPDDVESPAPAGTFDLRGDGTIAVIGRVSTDGGAAPWSVVVGPDGKVLPEVAAE